MKKILITSFLFLLTVSLFSQEISVKSFKPLSNDLTARMNPVTNDNAQTCALLKIITTETNFTFETDALGLCQNVEYKTAEIWLWLSPGSRLLTIKHPQLGQLRNYEYPVSIESACTYEMVLTTGRVKTIVEEAPTTNWLAITVEPRNALLKIDGEIVTTINGQLSKMLSVGEHTVEAVYSMYHPYRQKFMISPDEKTKLSIQMMPNFGYMNITTTPETGATVYIDGEKKGITPFKTDKMESKTYTVQVVKEMFKAVSQQVTVKDNQVEQVTLAMQPNFAEPKITCKDAQAEIWINGEKKGIGGWSGRLSAGAYQLEARKTAHKTSVSTLTLQNGDNQTIILESPEPIYGTLNVSSTPFDAEIYLNGKRVGTTPERLSNILIGDYELKLQKEGCSAVTMKITIKEDEPLEINETLRQGALVQIKSNPYSQVYIDGNLIGYSPVETMLSFGKHKVKLEAFGGVQRETSISVEENGQKNFTFEIDPPEQFSQSFLATMNIAYSWAPQLSYGFSLGMVKRWGWYFTAMCNSNFKGMGNPMQKGVVYDYTGNSSTTRTSVVAGAVLRTCKPLSLRLGAGFGYRALNFLMSDGIWYSFPNRTFIGADVNFGMLWHINSFVLTADVTTTNFKYVEFNLGLGVCLKMKKSK